MIALALPGWMIVALWLTTALNLVGAFAFAPLSGLGPASAGLPAEIHDVFRWSLAEFIGLFGLGYGWCAWQRRAPRMFIALGAAGKLAFFATLAVYWARGELPFAAVASGSPDLWFGLAFCIWLFQSRGAER